MFRLAFHILLAANLASCPFLCFNSPSDACCSVCVTDRHGEAECDHPECVDTAVRQDCDDEHGCPHPSEPCEGCNCICAGAIVKPSSVEELTASSHICHAYSPSLPAYSEPLALLDSPRGESNHESAFSGRQVCALLSRFLL